ncbi:MAG: hypothetical protein M3680_23465, partial [Myxococcota bacterium]|nr:hypothetical protein [Myxococcota bacterium]
MVMQAVGSDRHGDGQRRGTGRDFDRIAVPGRQSLHETTGGTESAPTDLASDGLSRAQAILSDIRTASLPRFVATIEQTELDPMAQQLAILKAAQRVQYGLLSARRHLSSSESTGSTAAPGAAASAAHVLRAQLDALRTDATDRGVFRSPAELVPARPAAPQHLDQLGGSGPAASPTTAPAAAVPEHGAPPTGDSKRGARFVIELASLKTKLGTLTGEARWQISVTRQGQASGKVGSVNGKVGATESIVEGSFKKDAQSLTHKVSSSLAKLDVDLFDGKGLMLLGVPFTVKVETKFLDAALSLDELKLEAMKVTVILVGDLTSTVPDGFTSSLELRLQLAVPADLAHHLLQLAQATKYLERAAKIEERLGAAKRQLANRRKIAGKLGKRASSLSTAERGRLLSLQREIKELEGKVGKIGKLRQGAIKARRMAIHV